MSDRLIDNRFPKKLVKDFKNPLDTLEKPDGFVFPKKKSQDWLMEDLEA